MTMRVSSLARWGLALLLVLALHLGLLFWSLYWKPQAMPALLAPPAMLVELAPLPEVAPAPAPAQAAPPPQPEPQVEPEVVPEPQPRLVEAPKPKLALAPPKPKPKPRPPKAKPRPPEPKPVQPPSRQVSETVSSVPSQGEPAAVPSRSQQAAGGAPSRAQINWQTRLLSHLGRYKRYPEDARRRGIEGVNKLRFVVDAQGRVLDFELVGRSGNASLDRATLQMIRRAQPLPKPPQDMLKDGRLEIVAPFVFSLDRRR